MSAATAAKAPPQLVDMAVELQKARLVELRLGRLKDEGRLRHEQVCFGRLNDVRQALAIGREARAILGASAITTKDPVMRHASSLESVYTYEGTNEVHTLLLGQAITSERAVA